MKKWTDVEGSPSPLGVTWIEESQAYNFALYSKHAESVTLLIFEEESLVNPTFELRLDYLKNKSGRVWHCRVPKSAVGNARYYAYSVAGPEPQGSFEWHQFDPEKVLLDPYAKTVYFPPTFERAAAMRQGSNAGKAPLGLLAARSAAFDWRNDVRPRHEADAIIYELHVRGFTANSNSGVSPQRRGTFAGLAEKIPYLKDLGVTVVELMPVFQCDPQEGSYWGYMPLSFFAPHEGYASKSAGYGPCEEFRSLVRALHAADIEVVLDVVYNHTAEGDQNGPIYSYKGIDNSSYYLLSGSPAAPYQNFSGTGNTLHCRNRHVRKMILDSLRYWVKEMHVDGFRFDLASVFARNDDGSLNLDDPPIFGEIVSDPDLANVRLIAEPWDAAGAYQLGRNFPGIRWLQWNGRFRDDLRQFVRGDSGHLPALIERLYGSDDLFPDDWMNAFHAYQSVNYITAHDGFTLCDLVSYNQKRNWANGHNNSDGPADEYSWNCGWEGDDGVPAEVLALRKRQVKNFCCLLMLANGTPMFRAGDEFMHTQGGNSNPYNQDNAITWLDWQRLADNQDVFRFFRLMIAFRKAHPSLARSRFWREDVRWYGPGPSLDMGHDSQTLAVYLRGDSQQDNDLYLMINASTSDVVFQVHEGQPGAWRRVVDTALASPDDIRDEPSAALTLKTASYIVQGRSVVVLLRNTGHRVEE
jgi:isoamylase